MQSAARKLVESRAVSFVEEAVLEHTATLGLLQSQTLYPLPASRTTSLTDVLPTTQVVLWICTRAKDLRALDVLIVVVFWVPTDGASTLLWRLGLSAHETLSAMPAVA